MKPRVLAAIVLAVCCPADVAPAQNDCCHFTINKATIGGPARQLARYETTTSAVVVSRNHRWVLFEPRGFEYSANSLRIARADGSGEREVVRLRGSIDDFALAPNQHRIALSTYQSPHGSETGLWVVNIDGSGIRRVASAGRNVSWSPDSRRLAYQLGDRLHVIGADGSNDRELARGLGHVAQWSPDGRRLVYIARSGIHVVSTAGGPSRLVARDSGGGLSDPKWSPDGRRIVFVRHYQGTAEASMWVVPAGGGRAMPVLTRWSEVPASVTWSPKGKRLAYVGNRGRLCVVRVVRDASCRRVAQHDGRVLDGLSWSRDGRGIVYVTDTPD